MNDAFGVRRVECVGDFNGESESGIAFEWASGDGMLESHAIQKFHGDESLAVMLVDFVNGADVGMIQRRGGLGLALEAGQCLGIFWLHRRAGISGRRNDVA